MRIEDCNRRTVTEKLLERNGIGNVRLLIFFTIFSLFCTPSFGQYAFDLSPAWAQDPPDINVLIGFGKQQSELRIVMTRYSEDFESLKRRYPVPYSPVRRARLKKFFTDWQENLKKAPFEKMSQEGKIDYVLLRNDIEYQLKRLLLEEKNWNEFVKMVPFADSLRMLQEDRFDKKSIDPMHVGAMLDRKTDEIDALNMDIKSRKKNPGGLVKIDGVSQAVALRAADYLNNLKAAVVDWNKFYDGYDPDYNFWVREVFGRLQKSLENYRVTILTDVVGTVAGDPDSGPIMGDPVGADGLQADLDHEMIPYSPTELLAIAQREFDWTIKQFKAVSKNMGYGDDWKKALEYVKDQAPPPGQVVKMLYDIANYSFDYISKMNYVTLPKIEFEVWRLRMRTPAEQLFAPFFLGGEYTSASYPTDVMDYKFKMMSMRGNTPHFNFPTVQHELIPGHYHQGFMRSRFNPERSRIAGTPFWSEGNAFYWETQLWDQGNFARNDNDKMGMLFWRLHRAARIVFSLNFHLGKWTPQQCVDFLVDSVGHERSNAEGEVRRSFSHPYFSTLPLYQLAYMIGALQHRALFKEAVTEKSMNPRVFHDAILVGGSMPLEMVRARILNIPLTRDYKTNWRWNGDVL